MYNLSKTGTGKGGIGVISPWKGVFQDGAIHKSGLGFGQEARELVGAGVSAFIQGKGWPVALPSCPWIKDLVCAPFDSRVV